MKSNAGLTTTSIIVYLIAMMIVIGIISTITSFFYTNIAGIDENSSNISEITKFQMYFLEETTKQNNAIYKIQENAISFISGNTFTFQDNHIYFNHIKICDHISSLKFATENVNDKTIISVFITIGENSEYSKTTKYVLNTNM